MNGLTNGFTYAEVLIALAIFCIVLVPVFPALTQAVKNDAYARSRYQAQLYANELMQSAKKALSGSQQAEEAVQTAAAFAAEMEKLSFTCGCWVVGGGTEEGTAYISPGAPERSVTAYADLPNSGGLHTAELWIVAVVWDAEGYPAGRAVGAVN